MLAAAYAAIRSLRLTIGVHFGWNFAGAGIFGTEVSGNGAGQGLLGVSTSGPELLTGGQLRAGSRPVPGEPGVLLPLVFLRLDHRRGDVMPFGSR
ncbi:hypothetical protein [Streptomyces sp. B1I3]|uniref:hypothetical protein n=1 Tax=Streptomyces sp. B1I3 TaxID=3042264 RepID=UPI0027D7FF06|nr:hypothetical protein [Streptomyces sp. B1I3]